MIINLSKQDPDDPQNYVESERSRSARQKELHTQVTHEIRSAEIASKRADRLDKYFSQHPPSGSWREVYQGTLIALQNTNGESPRWLTFPHLEASFSRLEQKGVLKLEVTTDKIGAKSYKSEVTPDAMAKRRNVRPAELDALVAELKKGIASHLGDGEASLLDTPALAERNPVHGCRYVPVINKWRVSLYFGGSQRALGCYSFSTALRLQDTLAFHFSSYRRPVNYNTSEVEAQDLLAQHPALRAFASALEAHWLAAGVLRKPVEIISTECRLTAIEETLAEINKKLDEIRRVMQTRHDIP